MLDPNPEVVPRFRQRRCRTEVRHADVLSSLFRGALLQARLLEAGREGARGRVRLPAASQHIGRRRVAERVANGLNGMLEERFVPPHSSPSLRQVAVIAALWVAQVRPSDIAVTQHRDAKCLCGTKRQPKPTSLGICNQYASDCRWPQARTTNFDNATRHPFAVARATRVPEARSAPDVGGDEYGRVVSRAEPTTEKVALLAGADGTRFRDPSFRTASASTADGPITSVSS